MNEIFKKPRHLSIEIINTNKNNHFDYYSYLYVKNIIEILINPLVPRVQKIIQSAIYLYIDLQLLNSQRKWFILALTIVSVRD